MPLLEIVGKWRIVSKASGWEVAESFVRFRRTRGEHLCLPAAAENLRHLQVEKVANGLQLWGQKKC